MDRRAHPAYPVAQGSGLSWMEDRFCGGETKKEDDFKT